ncbi:MULTISPECIES: type II toxin-antitoxin system Phd/YefM family antitoxin [unclassified Sphingomonas]|uniref:type II toxin-antitoxin system Phd/YefM family antitoxin n=1 Tax=unclassified Sphingomonas TaxID=196159 RepID=UPI00138F680B|nr:MULTISPECIES: type II toxin-antitoxin system Phd/YefM family antitoxin [unclassified Sphingomonas]
MDSISLGDATRDLGALIDRVVAERTPVAIERDDGVGVVMVAAGDWAAIEEMIW